LALTKLDSVHTNLDTIAASVASTVNTAQAAGVDLNGATGQPLFSGTTAATLALALTNGAGIATAPAGAPANSRDASNLTAMQTALSTTDPAGKTDALIFDISSTVAGRQITSDALKTIADTAKVNLAAQAGVSLDNEAVNLVRYQQAFQASGKVMQCAKDIFDTLLAIR
ncbi:MAG TPA: flagellar basal body rod C-terminal domain-containing protein, partial [Novosphingobium sp.]